MGLERGCSVNEVKLHYAIENGSEIVAKNWRRIRAMSDKLCTNVRHPKIDPATYKEVYHVLKGKEGFAFVEVTHGMGGGHERSLKRLVIRMLMLGCRVVVEDADLPLVAKPDWFEWAEKRAKSEVKP
jgi:hypothetical protein